MMIRTLTLICRSVCLAGAKLKSVRKKVGNCSVCLLLQLSLDSIF